MSLITIFGASGFIGSHLLAELSARNHDHIGLGRGDATPKQNLGDVIYCIGVTADFRSKPFETVNAHVCKLSEVLQDCEFNSLTYLSSTRVYGNNSNIAREEDAISVSPENPSDLYNASKAMGESLTLNCGRNTRVVRLSNVYGDDFESQNFLTTIIKAAVNTQKVTLQTAADSEKDYVGISDVVSQLLNIAASGKERIYNLASGCNVTNGALATELKEVCKCEMEFAANAPSVVFPRINIERLSSEFDFQPRMLLQDLESLVSSYRQSLETE